MKRFKSWIKLNIMSLLPTKLWVRIDYYVHFGKKLSLNAPKSFNEKLNWMKCYYHDDMRSTLVDKYGVREYVKNKIGEEYLIPLLGVWDSPDQIDFDALPTQFVLKPTHTSGDVFICRDKSGIDIAACRKLLRSWLKRNYYKQGREWEYKFVKPRIIAEKYMVDESGNQLRDYKFFCFDGVTTFLFIATDRQVDTKFDFYDINFNHLPVKNGHENAVMNCKKPEHYDDMVKLATTLSEGFPHVRIDLYNISGKIYFGEFTFYHNSAAVPFVPKEWDYKFGEYFYLPQKKL